MFEYSKLLASRNINRREGSNRLFERFFPDTPEVGELWISPAYKNKFIHIKLEYGGSRLDLCVVTAQSLTAAAAAAPGESSASDGQSTSELPQLLEASWTDTRFINKQREPLIALSHNSIGLGIYH
ncbi:hypothetical protein RRG08_018965 [Elysia crispata]|uniref:Uncharacterized protein n=1 Tax=Elysia crispata TaxID=231223 RepID=A0AAE1A4Z0_9GAST|nr:hypothetical protein RRG08_018965 [Elysia crispata]